MNQRIAGAPSTARVLPKDMAVDQIVDVAQSRVRGAFLELRPLARRELSEEAVEQPIDHVALAGIEGIARVCGPEFGLVQDGGEDVLGAVKGAAQAFQKPSQPRRDVER